MKVVIVGAGIGGLTTALRLHREGIECAVYEQSSRIGELGVGINALPHAVKELAALGLLDRLDEIGIRTRELFYTHRLGQVILRKPCGLDAGFTLPQYCLHRGRLQNMLLQAVETRLGPDAVRTGHRLTGFDQDPRGVRVRFVERDSGETVTVAGDVLVAADGIHSAARSLLFPEEGPPRWNGVLMWRGATDWPEFGGGASMIVSGGTAAKLVVYPIGPGRTAGARLTNWAVCVRTGQPGTPPPERQDWAKPGDRAELARHVGRFRCPAVDHAAMIEATEEIFEFPMCDRDPLPAWSHGRVTLLGDAAHPMYPMGSNGAGQAILDASSLASHLTRHADPAEALRAYEADRLAATSEIVLRNRLGGPENVIDEVERRAPDGFARLEDVIDAAALEAIVSGYARVSGASPQQVNRA
ncbi:flavin-dependent oxidoreductase [Amycolatopsis echigonensis]|uniref:2-polyprenyl-6-methoxyphenol hydroxylase-like FAD-dependent oxidoreductase n=1 Tax=Amycolatopsis echigonensis TaxID=2576905 RepID=A0A2N3WS24_9PSEU|nr:MULTISPECIES: flavin-dependent oxidoreductase [Amycolatopsis]MBB2505294.1 flavin-dependent oxidoreductase [Amycolatopsis echigonensis]PKV96682.1 2-polyprenyl-6-methoxyphenol hydroxylase-like FAD-dependent oxidoreductase [Amycolatopsis niigatensis]